MHQPHLFKSTTFIHKRIFQKMEEQQQKWKTVAKSKSSIQLTIITTFEVKQQTPA